MNSGLKTGVLWIAFVVIIGGGSYFSYTFLRDRIADFNDNNQMSTEEGRALGQGRNQLQCFDSLVVKARDCNELKCGVRLGGLLTGCLDVATPSEALCEGIPGGSQKDGYAWADEMCKKKHGSSNVGCAVLYRTLQERCQSTAPKKTENA